MARAARPQMAHRRPARRRPRQAGRRASVFEGKGRDNDSRRGKFDATRTTATRVATAAARDKGRDFGGRDKGGRGKRDSGPSHRQWATSARRASATVRSIPIRRSQNWRRSRNSSRAARIARQNAVLDDESCLERQRLDKWLWHARVVKARTCAAALVEAGHVRINGVREKAPGHAVKIGDVLTIALDRTVRILKVVGFSERRGDATAARVLYEDLQERRNDYLTELAANA